MPQVHHVKKARKDFPGFGIEKGDSYYWWKFRYGGMRKSKTYPSRSQLTQSPFYQELYDIQDNINIDREDIESSIQEMIDRIQELHDQCEDSLYNMPEHLQETSNAGIMLQERIDALDNWISDLESIDIEIDEDVEDSENRIDEIIDEIESCSPDI